MNGAESRKPPLGWHRLASCSRLCVIAKESIKGEYSACVALFEPVALF
jgi:hypothetical protein